MDLSEWIDGGVINETVRVWKGYFWKHPDPSVQVGPLYRWACLVGSEVQATEVNI